MSITGKKGVGIPMLLFHEGEGLTVSVETKSGTLYRGKAEATEDSFNLSIRHATAFYPDGTTAKMDKVFVRGSQILFVVFPEILANAPYFERVRAVASGKEVVRGLGRGRQAAMAKGEAERRWEGGVGEEKASLIPRAKYSLTPRPPRPYFRLPFAPRSRLEEDGDRHGPGWDGRDGRDGDGPAGAVRRDDGPA
jgi:small nuclear ribonucleoprotein D3